MTCWKTLGIEPTQDIDLIRAAYRARLPKHHPESNPCGFQALRSGYEAALEAARAEPADRVLLVDTPPDAGTQLLSDFEDLLEDPARRFNVHAWQVFIRQLDSLPLDRLEDLGWGLLNELMQSGPLSSRCALLLVQRLGWSDQLLNVDFDSARRIDEFLHDLKRPDPFDVGLMGEWSPPAQMETLWYINSLDQLYQHRPLHEYVHFASQATCVALPADPALMRRMLVQHTLAGMAGKGLREACVELHHQAPEDLDALFLLTRQNTLLGLEEHALQGWLKLWHEHRHPKAADYLLELCERHHPQRLPLLIQAFDRREEARELDIRPDPETPAMHPETLARWFNALRADLDGFAGAYAQWQVGGDTRPLQAFFNDDEQDADLHRLYRHAWALREGAYEDLQQVLDEPPSGDVLEELILEGFRYRAGQKIRAQSAPPAAEGSPACRMPEPVSPWAFWRLGTRLGRAAFFGQSLGLTVFGLLSALMMSVTPGAALTLLALTLLLLAGASVRRLHDMGRGTPTLLLGVALAFVLPVIPLALFVWPGDRLPNRYGLPPGAQPHLDEASG
ncbi:DUF805 domain-containing protein [Pseudomonas sp. K2I15]|uniref:DUF805 domain-containing protein n=1 Tax=unclassified Pseudomonas TaxID=196821 RepID=UPI001595D4AF|nr:DUF805 domain-containing protein [Pseudomonas sp. K2I15]